MINKWKEIHITHTPPPTIERWMPQDKEELQHLKMMEIDLLETALGCYAALMKRITVMSVMKLLAKEWEEYEGRGKHERDMCNSSN